MGVQDTTLFVDRIDFVLKKHTSYNSYCANIGRFGEISKITSNQGIW